MIAVAVQDEERDPILDPEPELTRLRDQPLRIALTVAQPLREYAQGQLRERHRRAPGQHRAVRQRRADRALLVTRKTVPPTTRIHRRQIPLREALHPVDTVATVAAVACPVERQVAEVHGRR
jgi:hypothetical protein